MIDFMPHQETAIRLLKNGNILYGGVGSGKSITALGYYLRSEAPKKIFVITTGKKRDSLDWDDTASKFGIFKDASPFSDGILIDSWHNITKYVNVTNAFFIFDEQRVVGSGIWVKSFIKITKNNNWILLSATPGDVWLDYAPVFVANGWYKNITEFKREHVVYDAYVRFPKVKCYRNIKRLENYRNQVLVEMPYLKHTERFLNYIDVGFNERAYNQVLKTRRDPKTNIPFKNAAGLFRSLREIVNSDTSRLSFVLDLMKTHKKMIIFYNFNYELDILRLLGGSFFNDGTYEVAEYNGHKKEDIPTSSSWLYLVQYSAGAEGWECTETNAVVLYSLTYSYKTFEQAQGRIDRLNTPFTNLYYYVLTSSSSIDRAILKALNEKRNFNILDFDAKFS